MPWTLYDSLGRQLRSTVGGTGGTGGPGIDGLEGGTGGSGGTGGTGAQGSEGLPGLDGPQGATGQVTLTLTSPSTITSGDQAPPSYFTASRAGTVKWAAISGDGSAAAIVATFKKNGADMWAGSTKPEVPGGGGVSVERAPDGGSFHLAAGDYLTLNLTGGTDGPVAVYVGFQKDN